jgi:hypothetical protein
MQEIQGHPEAIKQLEKAVWFQVQGRAYWIINAENCYGIVQLEGDLFRARIMAEGSRLHSADLAKWETQALACDRVEEWLLNKRQLGLSAVQTASGQFSAELCPIRPIVFPTEVVQSPQLFQELEPYSPF